MVSGSLEIVGFRLKQCDHYYYRHLPHTWQGYEPDEGFMSYLCGGRDDEVTRWGG